ncbi:MAG: hypothetical protein IPJ13_16530 [Saprospiraceae bacterium]|nr:hypothetical protein [Saprospiraceae bacterium]
MISKFLISEQMIPFRKMLVLGLIAVLSCSDLEDEDRITILNYLDTRNLISTDTSGVYVVITKPGDQSRPGEKLLSYYHTKDTTLME